MNKDKFVTFLRKELEVLKDSEIDEIVTEYSQHIDMKVAAGVSEEDAIKDFGDLDDFVAEILDAYKVDYYETRREHMRNQRFEDFGERVKRGLNKSLDFVTRIANGVMASSGKEIISIVIEFVIVLFLILLVNVGISFVMDLLRNLFYFRPYFITKLIRVILDLFSGLFKIFATLLILYWFFKERVLDQLPIVESKPRSESQTTQYFDHEASAADAFHGTEESEGNFAYANNNSKDRFVYQKRTKTSDSTFWKTVKNFLFWCIKITGYIILIPLVVLIALGIVAALWFLVMTFKGVGSWGILMIGLGSLILVASVVFGTLGWLSGSELK